MKTFNSRSAVEEYMSTHSLGFSTPDLTLKGFVIWLCEQVNDPNGKEVVPRIMLYLKGEESAESGRDLSHTTLPKLSGTIAEPKITAPNKLTAITESKFCIECGSKLNLSSRFCIKCGTKQAEV
jgi:ribosomal protein L40E